jgi:regulator of protease activity HflC (stomatin/prohibitin superfamily)
VAEAAAAEEAEEGEGVRAEAEVIAQSLVAKALIESASACGTQREGGGCALLLLLLLLMMMMRISRMREAHYC